jgi:hypothetical protein
MDQERRRWHRSVLESHRTGWVCIVVALALAMPSVADGFSSDDDILLPALEGNGVDAAPWYDLYYFAGRRLQESIEQGILPWWSAPDLRLHLVRPLPSALLSLDHALFGRAAVGYHLHSLLWLGALLVLARKFFLSVLDRPAANLALAVFAFSPSFTLAARLVAARHILVTAVAVTAGLLLLLEESSSKRRWTAACAFVVGLAGGEGGLAGLAFWAMYELLGPSASPLRARVRRVFAPGLIGLAYLVVYAIVDGGARQMDLYVDPLHEPVEFLKAVSTRVPMLLGNVVWLADAGLGVFWPGPVIALGVAGVWMVAWIFGKASPNVPPLEKASLRWLVPGALLATLGVSGGMPGGRELVLPSLGFAPLVATILTHGWRRLTDESTPTMSVRRSVVAWLFMLHVVLAPVATLGTWALVRRSALATIETARQLRDAAGGARRVILLSASDPAIWIYGLRLARREPSGSTKEACWWVASATKADHRMTQLGSHGFSLETLGTTFLSGDTERMYRAKRVPLAVGAAVAQCGSSVRVAAAVDGRPTRVDVQVDSALDDPDVALLTWRNGHIERVSFTEVASGLTIPWSPGPLGML